MKKKKKAAKKKPAPAAETVKSAVTVEGPFQADPVEPEPYVNEEPDLLEAL